MKNLKLVLPILMLSVLYASVCSCEEPLPTPVAVTTVTLNSTSMELTEGDTMSLTATVSPSNAENKKILWSSSNSSVATVKEGVVTAVKAGNAKIIAKSDDGGKTATCDVTVKEKVYPVESVSLDRTNAELTEGDEITLKATVKPDNATNKSVVWTSSNESVAKVVDGKVTALKAGSATITVKTQDGNKTAACDVTVKAKVYPVESVSLDRTSAELTEGDEITLKATVKPDNATNKSVIWTSSNESVAKVVDGKVTALKAGSATITVKTQDGNRTAACDVTVKAKVYPVENIVLDLTYIEIEIGNEMTIRATVYPSYATNQNLIWTSSDSSVASVSAGKVIAKEVGCAVIKATPEDGAKAAVCNVKVLSAAPGGGNENVGENQGGW